MTESTAEILSRPRTLKELSKRSRSLEEFGYNLRDWQHEISRTVTNRKELARRMEEAPGILSDRFEEGDVADAYLAAYAEWIALRAGIACPKWAKQTKRSVSSPWYADSNKRQLETLAPESFRRRGIFTIPDDVFRAKRGRPRVSAESKRLRAIERQRAYRKRIRALVARARKME